MITVRTVVVAEAFARANVMEAFGGRGAPAGVISCVQSGTTIALTFDDQRTAGQLIDTLVEIAVTLVPQSVPPLADTEIIALAARGLNEPALSAARLIETYLP